MNSFCVVKKDYVRTLADKIIIYHNESFIKARDAFVAEHTKPYTIFGYTFARSRDSARRKYMIDINTYDGWLHNHNIVSSCTNLIRLCDNSTGDDIFISADDSFIFNYAHLMDEKPESK